MAHITEGASRFVGTRIFLALICIPVLYVGACSHISNNRSKAFEAVKIGDTEETVINQFGSPSVREMPNVLFSRYATEPCINPCEMRLWFENRLTLDTEAWSVELDTNQRVIRKHHWVSP
ncbi:MAG: hypothetical protein ABL892_04755 [Thiobacillaceae bacterium]